IRRRVDLPHPLGPIRAVTWPVCASRSVGCRAMVAPNRLLRLWTAIISYRPLRYHVAALRSSSGAEMGPVNESDDRKVVGSRDVAPLAGYDFRAKEFEIR